MHPARTLMGVTPASAMLDIRAMDSIVQVKLIQRTGNLLIINSVIFI